MKIITLLLAPLLLLVGCATTNTPTYTVLVDGMTNPDTTKGQTFVISPLNEGVDSSDLQFKEFRRYVRKAMLAQGFIQGEYESNSDITILLAYGVSDPEQREITYNRPVYGQTGVSSKSTTANYYGSDNKVANAIRGGNYTSTTTYTPTYGITGYVPETYTKVTFHRYVYIYAKDLREGVPKEHRLRWKLMIDSSGSSGDLRKVFPVMIAASKQYLGKNTQGAVETSISGTDPRISDLIGNQIESINEHTP